MRSPFLKSPSRRGRLFWPLLCLFFALGYSTLFHLTARMAEESWREAGVAAQSESEFRDLRRRLFWGQIENYMMNKEIRKLRRANGPKKM